MMPSKYKFLLDRFDYKDIEEVFVSEKTALGLGTGDDAKLYIHVDEHSTTIWWRSNRGHETIAFDGLHLDEEAMEAIFHLLGVDKILKWKGDYTTSVVDNLLLIRRQLEDSRNKMDKHTVGYLDEAIKWQREKLK